jgi:lipoprotein NlpD
VTERTPVGAKPKAAPREADPRPRSYTVQKGDTLYGIALENGLDYKELAEWNGIEQPYLIRVNQQLRLFPPEQTAVAAPLRTVPPVVASRQPEELPKTEKQVPPDAAEKPAPAQPVKSEAPPGGDREPADKKDGAENGAEDDRMDWGWPAEGKITTGFSDSANGKGLDIAGKLGQPVHASASGKVVYVGNGLRGYGKLIIIKHNKTYLSAYAHNHQILVKEGQNVSKGQKIAEMGNSDADQVKLHFEIRRFGKPVDPLKYLPSDRSP